MSFAALLLVDPNTNGMNEGKPCGCKKPNNSSNGSNNGSNNKSNNGSNKCVDCKFAHKESGLNYPWLSHIHGGLDHIEVEEPVGTGIWKKYTEDNWKSHCDPKIVDHHPDQCVKSHMKAFVNPRTRFARLHFHFKDGHVQEPVEEFYRLEAEWFRQNGCY